MERVCTFSCVSFADFAHVCGPIGSTRMQTQLYREDRGRIRRILSLQLM